MFNKYIKLLVAIIVVPIILIFPISNKLNSDSLNDNFTLNNNHNESVGKVEDSWAEVRGLGAKFIAPSLDFSKNQAYALELVKSLFVDSTLQTSYDQVKNLILGTTNNADLLKIVGTQIVSFKNESWKVIKTDTLNYLENTHLITSYSDLENNKTDITKSNLSYYGLPMDATTSKLPGFFAWNDINSNLPSLWSPQSVATSPWNSLFATNVWISYVDSSNSFFKNGTEDMANYLAITNWTSLLGIVQTQQISWYNSAISTIANNFRSLTTLYFINPDGSFMNGDFLEFQSATVNNFFKDWGASFINGVLVLDQTKILATLSTWMANDQVKSGSYVIPTKYNNLVFNIIESVRESILITNKLDYLQNQNSFFNNNSLQSFLNNNDNENITNINVNQTTTIDANTFSSLPSLTFTQSGKDYTLSLYEYGIILLNDGTNYTYIDLDGNVYNNAQVTATSSSVTINGDVFTFSGDDRSYLPDLTFIYDNKNVTAKLVSSSSSLFMTSNGQYDSTDSVNIKMSDPNDKSFNYEIANKFSVSATNFDFIKLHHDFANSTTSPNATDFAFSWNFSQDKFNAFSQGADFFKKYYVPGTLPNPSIPPSTIEKVFFVLFSCLIAGLIIFVGYFISRYYHERKLNYTDEQEILTKSKK